MASSSNQIQELSTQFPFEMKPGENQTPPSQLQSGLSPLSPQLRYFLCRKQPRIKVSPPSSRSFPKPSPSPHTLALISNGPYYKVPSKWCPDSKVWSRDLYLSRNSLLKKMIHQRILYRTNVSNNIDGDKMLGFKMFGSPVDYWVTFPLHPPIGLEIAELPELRNVSVNEVEAISIVYATGPVKSTRYSLNRMVGEGWEPDYDGIPFPWVTNSTGTKFRHRKNLESKEIKDIIGLVECPICKEVWCMSYLVPERFNKIDEYLGRIVEKVIESGDKILQNCHFECSCDGKSNRVRPIISEDLNKINWMFLFLGFGIGYCTVDQLKYYCNRRKLPIPDNTEKEKEKLLVAVFIDLRLQITKRTVRP